MPRRGENIYKRKDGRWEGRYISARIGSKVKYGYVYSKQYSDVKDKLREITTADVPRGGASSFIACSTDCIDTLRPVLKESTVIKYEYILSAYIYPYFGEMSVSGISNGDISNFTEELLTKGGKNKSGLSAKTVSDILSVMKKVLEFAGTKGIAVNAGTDCVTLRRPPSRMYIFGISEQQSLTEYLCQNLTLSNAGILLCLYTGLRIGELCALKWGDIDLRGRTLSVTKTMQRIKKKNGAGKTKITVTPPKSGCSVRKIPIPCCLIPLLSELACDENTYFLTGRADKFTEPRTMENRFGAVLKKCGILGGNFHALRHTFATRCVELGFDAKSLSEILGHASVNITLNRYIHPSMEHKRKNMDRLSDLFNAK